MYGLVRPLLFCLEPETVHKATMLSLHFSNRLGLTAKLFPAYKSEVTLFGLTFANRIGLAAGFDKNGQYLADLDQLGFGFIEIGTVTPLPQAGNPKPRLFRLANERAIINRMGFNNLGLDSLISNIRNVKHNCVLGISIGKNAATSESRIIDDYLNGLNAVYSFADYVAINISSPNTAGLRKLQDWDALPKLLGPLKKRQGELKSEHGKYVPLVVKLAPDLSTQEIEAIGRILLQLEIDGVIATNTTISREAVEGHPLAVQAGGLSGRPLTKRSLEVVKTLAAVLEKKIPIIGSGGVMSPEDAAALVKSGASLVQLYTGLIYKGPALIAKAAEILGG